MSDMHHEILNTHLQEAKKFILSQKNSFADLNIDECIDTLSLTYLAIKNLFSIEPLEVISCITEGGGDNAIDAIFLEEEQNVLTINIFQTKFKKKFVPAFDKNEIAKFVDKFNKLKKRKPFEKPNPRLKLKWSEVQDACIGNTNFIFKIHFITNGTKPNKDVLDPLNNLGSEHIVEILGAKELLDSITRPRKRSSPITVSTRGSDLLIESIGNIKAFVCSLPVNQLTEIYKKCGKDDVLQSNIRHYLGKRNKVNSNIRNTALDKKSAKYFWFQNNGISIVCDKLSERENPNGFRNIDMVNPVIVNGGQTTRTLYDLKEENQTANFSEMFVLTRIFETDSPEIINRITKSTNSQSPIFFRDLESNNATQNLIKQTLAKEKIYLETKRNEYDGKDVDKTRIIKNDTLMQYYVSTFEKAPSEAKQSKSRTFENYFDKIFIESDTKLFDKVQKSYLIYEFIKAKELSQTEGYLRHANFAIAYLLSKYTDPIKESTDKWKFSLEKDYGKVIKIITKIVKEEQERLGENYSHNNLFKSREIVFLMDKALQL